MGEVYLLDENRNRIYIIDNYNSLIWANRYRTLGDCELAIGASAELLEMFKNSTYIARDDDDMVCRIEKVQITTDIENGDQLIVTGYDIKKILGQRVVWTQTNFNGLVEDYLRQLVNENVINPKIKAREIDNFILDEKANFTETITQQVTYDNLRTKIEDTIAEYGWGYKLYLNDDKKFTFKLYKGEDKTSNVVFSEDYENLATTDYTEDMSDITNVALVAGEGEGADRLTSVTGSYSGLSRYELYVDAKELSKTVDYGELKIQYPNGKEVQISGITYYQVDGVNIAIITATSTEVTARLTDNFYNDNLNSKGVESLAEHKVKKEFTGSIEPSLTFVYKQDYNLGDIVTIENKYGVSIDARITEIIEVNNNDGYSIEPTFEYLQDTLE